MRRRFALSIYSLGIISALVCGASARQLAPAPPEVATFLKDSEAARANFLKLYLAKDEEVAKHLAAAKRGVIVKTSASVHTEGGKVAYRFTSVDQKNAKIEMLADRKVRLAEGLRALKSGKGWPLYSFALPFKVGSIGSGGLRMKVDQVIDKQNCIVTWRQPIAGDVYLWANGIDTSKMADGQEIVLWSEDSLLHIPRTRTYGARTLLEIAPLSLDKIRPYLNDGDSFVPYPTN